ncbi:MAG TPA: signal peptidase I [Thermoanaerobaculia bacterium]
MERSVAREYLEALIIAAIFLRFTNTFVIQTFYIPSGSMEETLLIGDHLFVNRFIYGPAATDLERKVLPLRDVERGDIVVFRSPENPQMDVVKRCIGLPGDTIDVVDKRLSINGKVVDDSLYAIHRDPNVYSAGLFLSEQGVRRDNFGPEQVPEGKYFCMGDNRDYSYDSRFWGTLPRHLIKGRSLFIYWSNGAQAPESPQQGFGGKLRDLARTAAGFFSNTRWERTFHLIR